MLTSVTVVGCAKNIGEYIPNSIKKIEMICSLFEKSKIIIYENDSTDNTLDQLLKWKNAEIITEKNVKGPRTVRLARGRNILLQKALYYDYEYFVVVDMDDKLSDLTKSAFLSSFDDKKFPNWSMIGSNQRGEYYDLWALRTFDGWMPFDCHECVRKTRNKNYCITSRLVHIDENSEPIKVKSCFGGLAIYKTKYIKYSKYNGLNSEDQEICEHVQFNEDIGNIYINPKMINHITKNNNIIFLIAIILTIFIVKKIFG
jgi:hypothetical protein